MHRIYASEIGRSLNWKPCDEENQGGKINHEFSRAAVAICPGGIAESDSFFVRAFLSYAFLM